MLNTVFVRFRDEWASWQAVVNEWRDAGHAIIALGEYRGTHRETGKSTVAAFAHVYEVREGRIARFRQFTDTAKVRDATTIVAGAPRSTNATVPPTSGPVPACRTAVV